MINLLAESSYQALLNAGAEAPAYRKQCLPTKWLWPEK